VQRKLNKLSSPNQHVCAYPSTPPLAAKNVLENELCVFSMDITISCGYEPCHAIMRVSSIRVTHECRDALSGTKAA
jgi:hypothetical protein